MEDLNLRKLKKSTVVLLLVAIGAILILLGILFGRPLVGLFSSREHLESTIKHAGALAPLVLIALQALQVVVAPIPGQVTSLAAGFLFGTVLGTLYSMIGLTIGFTIVFVLARILGRPFVEYFVNKKTLQKFDYLAESRGVFIFFLIFLLPFFPDDLICYIAGLTKIPIKKLVIISFIARVPSSLVFAFAGESIAHENVGLVIVVAVVGVLLSGLAWWKQTEIERFVKSFSKGSKA